MVDQVQLEQKLLRLLHLNFKGPDDPGLSKRRLQLRELFNSVPNPALAGVYYTRLSARKDHDPLSKEFHHRLATETRSELLEILKRTSHQPANAGHRTERGYRLVDEDHGGERILQLDSPEYLSRYIDLNQVSFTTDPDPRTFAHYSMAVHYKDGRTLELPLSAVPVRRRVSLPGARIASIRLSVPFDHYVLRRGTIIPVDSEGRLQLNETNSPNLIDARTTIELNIALRRSLLEITELTHTFSGLIGIGAGMLSFGMEVAADPHGGFSTRPKSRSRESTPPGGGKPPAEPYHLSKQYKQVGAEEMLMWENEGGHTLQRHNWQLTRQNLLQRIVGERILGTPPAKNGQKATDFRVWQGNKTSAASSWVDQATMNRTIGGLIHRNITKIRIDAAGMGEFRLEREAVGYRTGSGWVKTGGAPADQGGVFWDNDLRGVTVIIRARQNHIPTSSDPERWYVVTAYPDRASVP